MPCGSREPARFTSMLASARPCSFMPDRTPIMPGQPTAAKAYLSLGLMMKTTLCLSATFRLGKSRFRPKRATPSGEASAGSVIVVQASIGRRSRKQLASIASPGPMPVASARAVISALW